MFVSLPQLTNSVLCRAGSTRHDEKEVHGRAEPLTQGINRGHDGVPPTTKGRLAGIEPHAASADNARRPEVKAQPKVAAKTKKPAAKAKTTAKSSKPAAKAKPTKTAAKAPAKKASVKTPARPAAKAMKPAAKAVKPAVKAAGKAPAKSARTAVASAPKPAKSAAGKVVGAVAKAVVSGAKAVVAAAKKIPAKASPAPVKAAPAKASSPSAAPAAGSARAATVGAQALRQAQPAPRPAQSPVAPAPGAFGSAKATYTPMANPSVLTTPPVAPIKKDPKLANNWKTKSAEELSDAEVLAMPDTEYMNDKQMAFFRLKLQQLKLEILNSAGETTEHLREDTVIVPDPADRATIEEEHALELRTRDRERKLLKKIEQSIARIDAGDYGYCDETGEPIGVGRLLARPTATLSLEAQQRRELKQKMFGD
jgi:DnaK suppressor protein